MIVYTDGYFPDKRKGEAEEPRIGCVAFANDQEFPVAFSQEVPQEAIDFWIRRETQIVMIEAVALPVVAETFIGLIKGKNVVLFVDSDPVLGAAVNGYSGKEDICGLLGNHQRRSRLGLLG